MYLVFIYKKYLVPSSDPMSSPHDKIVIITLFDPRFNVPCTDGKLTFLENKEDKKIIDLLNSVKITS